MFKEESNGAFNNGLFSCPKIEGMHETAKRLYQAAKSLRNTEGQSAVARLLNASPQTLKNWEARGVSNPGMLTAQRLIGCSATWLETGCGDMVGDVLLLSSDTHRASARAESTAVEINLSEHPNLLEVPRVKFKLSAGISGYAVEPENGNGRPVFFETEWFLKNNYDPSRLFAVFVSGQSMETTLWDGDLVVINTAETKPYDGDVYAINYEGEMVIKRMRRDSGQWFATSDNPDQRRFSPKRCTEDVMIIGRVVHRQSERI